MHTSNSLTHLLHTCTSVSRANRRSVSSLWCIGDHLNSGMRNIVVRGPGLNWRRCSSVMGIPLKPRSTRRSRSSCAAVRPCRACKGRDNYSVSLQRVFTTRLIALIQNWSFVHLLNSILLSVDESKQKEKTLCNIFIRKG